jgi:hypothetical protein
MIWDIAGGIMLAFIGIQMLYAFTILARTATFWIAICVIGFALFGLGSWLVGFEQGEFFVLAFVGIVVFATLTSGPNPKVKWPLYDNTGFDLDLRPIKTDRYGRRL